MKMDQVKLAFGVAISLLTVQFLSLLWIYFGYANKMDVSDRISTIFVIFPLTAASAAVFVKNLSLHARSVKKSTYAPLVIDSYLGWLSIFVTAGVALAMVIGLLGFQFGIIQNAVELQGYVTVVQIILGVIFSMILDDLFRISP